jgi:hypothetical protein
MFLKYPLLQYICMWFRTNRSLCNQPGQGMFKASFVSTGSIPIGMDKYNKKIIIVTIRDPDLFRVEN